ncbi:MAG: protein kinase domain-containing protein [Gemmatimonadales bacterium]
MSVEPIRAALADRYTIERELGAGGMATVYLARDVKHDRQVAVKVLRPELAAVIGAERFLAEIRTTANLQHPHILALHDSGNADGFLFYVMPYIDGVSLRDRISREHQLPIADAVRIAAEVADALQYAHDHGVIHRDIKPENILLHGGHALVADFGIALAMSTAGTRMTETGMSLGTPHYMSPEQAMGEREIGPQSDVYALGCVTYEMLIGDPPFTGSTAQAIVAKVVTEAPRPLIAQRHTIPPQVEAAVLTALEKLPADRFASARAFADALGNPQFTSTTTHATAIQTTGRHRTTSPRAIYLLAGASVVLLLIALAGWLRHPSPPAVSRQRVVLWHHSLQRFLSPGATHEATQAAIAPDGSSIVFTDSGGSDAQLFRKRRDASDAVPLEGTRGGMSPFFSPDGLWVGYVTGDGKLQKVPVGGGGAITLATDVDPEYPSATWLDDETIVYDDSHIGMSRVAAAGGPSHKIWTDSSRGRMSPMTLAPIPGSHGVLFTGCPGNCSTASNVYVFDFTADSARLLVPGAVSPWYAPTGDLLYTDRGGGVYAVRFDPKRMVVTSGPVPVIDSVVPGTFVLSASGALLYLTGAHGAASAQLMWVSDDGRAEPLDSGWIADFNYPALSPDGRNLAVSVSDRTTQLWLRRFDGTRQQLTDSGSVNWRPSWTPDGRSIAFSSNMRGGINTDGFDIFTIPVDGSAPPALLMHYTYGLWEAELSHDGNWLAVRSDEAGGNSNIHARRLHGDTNLFPTVVGKGVSVEATLSPDGRWLAYDNASTGQKEIYVTAFPDGNVTRLVSSTGGAEPRWAHSGRQLFYESNGKMMSVGVAPGAALITGTPHAIFSIAGYRTARNRQQYDVAPDDRHFVMIRELPGRTVDLVYVENWLPELRARLKR